VGRGEGAKKRRKGVEEERGGEKRERGRKKRGKEGKAEEKRHFQKISALETELPHNTLKHRKELTFRRDFNVHS